MNSLTLGCFCTPRIGRADVDVASRAVDVNSRARRLCYPRGNFSVIPGPHQGGHGGSLGQAFALGILLGQIPIRPAYALALHTRFLTGLSRPLGPDDILSSGCHPSRTVCQQLSRWFFQRLAAQVVKGGVTLLSQAQPDGSALKRLPPTLYDNTRTAAAGYSKVLRGLHFLLELSGLCTRKGVRGLPTGDSDNLVTPFMHVTIQMTRHFATLRKS